MPITIRFINNTIHDIGVVHVYLANATSVNVQVSAGPSQTQIETDFPPVALLIYGQFYRLDRDMPAPMVYPDSMVVPGGIGIVTSTQHTMDLYDLMWGNRQIR